MTQAEAAIILKNCQHLRLPKPVRRHAAKGEGHYELHWSHSRYKIVVFDYEAARLFVRAMRRDLKGRS